MLKVPWLAQVGGRAGTAPGSRACKYVLNTLMQAFQLPALARAVAESTLRELTGELLYRLLDDRIPRLEEGTSLLKALNILMLKILENSRRNYSFSSLLHLLRTPPPAVAAEAAAGGGGGVPTKFSDLVVKCLIKLTKALGAALGEVDLDMLLLSIHQFFMGLGVDEIRRRGQEDDKPLRMVKTVLHEVSVCLVCITVVVKQWNLSTCTKRQLGIRDKSKANFSSAVRLVHVLSKKARGFHV